MSNKRQLNIQAAFLIQCINTDIYSIGLKIFARQFYHTFSDSLSNEEEGIRGGEEEGISGGEEERRRGCGNKRKKGERREKGLG